MAKANFVKLYIKKKSGDAMKKQYYWNIPDNLLNSLKQRKKLYNFYKNEQNKARE
ncbi:DUF7006 family protein, partial [Enterococcus faecalis]